MRIHGSRGQMSMDPAGATTYVAVADIKGWTLDLGRDTVNTTALGDTNKQAVLGLPNFTGTYTGFWNAATSPTLFDAILGTIAVGLKLTPDTAAATNFFSGLAYLSGGINVDAEAAVTTSGSFVAAGNWTLAP
jgi:hypothetical protein